MKFALALHSDNGVKYGVTVPDLPGCFSAGDTLDEAVESAREAIDAHCELLAERGETIPAARALRELMHLRDHRGAVWVLLDVDVSAYTDPPERVNITVPRALLRRIDAAARDSGQTRSGFLAHAATSAMGKSGARKPHYGPATSRTSK